ncbi:hypothetical protein [Azospirillum sp.]|uniref:hypothetical protein n=1 Tax=Azospirillum sp. TaxID=34012 RepID=UPI003D754384
MTNDTAHTQASLLSDLAFFADLGTEPPRSVSSGSQVVVRLVRNGRETELVIYSDGTIDEKRNDGQQKHLNFRALLASNNFGGIGRWADAQSLILQEKVAGNTIPVTGILSNHNGPASIDHVDAAVDNPGNSLDANVHILLIDGPAGIGKTSFIRSLAYNRAVKYRVLRHPLILHVESRGRMLQNIMDLMAFSLQTLRLNVTYDQIPILVRHGLVTLAIDGFDELGDPNGYELAWAQVNALISSVCGRGSLILSGRETFIGRDRLISALKSYRPSRDILNTVTLQPITPKDAKEWLKKNGWTPQALEQDNVEPLFEPGSYALRPFFLNELSREGVREQIERREVDDLTWFLAETMIKREADKFGTDVEAATKKEQREKFVLTFLGEVARDLAENQTDAISSDSLSWLAEMVAIDTVPNSLSGILKNRAGVIAFLIPDERPNYRRFSHSHLFNHFLSRITIDAVADGEVPKFVRRNIFGADLLSSFAEVIGHYKPKKISAFIKEAVARINELGDYDRSRGNLAALVVAAMGSYYEKSIPVLSDIAIDQAVVTQTAGGLRLRSALITQLDAREADLRAFEFDNSCHIVSLLADSGTALPRNFPLPQRVQLPDKILNNNTEIEAWITAHSPDHRELGSAESTIPSDVREHELYYLIGRISRHKRFWIRDSDDKSVRRILQDPYWGTLRRILDKHELLVVRNIGAAGPPTEFFHIKRKDQIIAEDMSDPVIRSFYEDVITEVRGNII